MCDNSYRVSTVRKKSSTTDNLPSMPSAPNATLSNQSTPLQTYFLANHLLGLNQAASRLHSPTPTSFLSNSPIFHALNAHIDPAATKYVAPTKTCDVKYPELDFSPSATGCAKIVGTTSGRQTMKKADCMRCMPVTSAVTGTMQPQKVPQAVPARRAKTSSTA